MARGEYEISYAVYLDGQPVEFESVVFGKRPLTVIGSSKREAMRMFPEQWRLAFGDAPMPPRRRLKLVEVDRVNWGRI